MDPELSLEFLRVVEQAAIAAGHTMGQGDRHKADRAAVESMRKTLDSVPIDGTIVIGEGERDEAPMLYIGEKVGRAHADDGPADRRAMPRVDIAVDPLEGTNLCCTGEPNAPAVLAASDQGGLLHAPDLYMEKLVVGPDAKHAVFLDAPVAHNLKGIARALSRRVEDLVICVLDRPRHARLIGEIRDLASAEALTFAATGVTDGDLLRGVRFFGDGVRTHSVIMETRPARIRFVDTIHVYPDRDFRVRF